MLPSGVAFSLRLYLSMTLSGMSLNFIQMNSGWCKGVMRFMLEMSTVMKRAPFVEMMLSKSILVLATSISMVGVATLPRQLILSPSTVNRVQLGSPFSGCTVHTNCLCVTSHFCSFGTSCVGK